MRLFLSCLAALLTILSHVGPAAARQATDTEPVVDADFPNAAVLRSPHGLNYAYATQSQRDGHWINFRLARSPDLIHRPLIDDALPQKPHWASTTQDFSAPHVVRDGKRYLSYFSAKPNTSDERYGIGVELTLADWE